MIGMSFRTSNINYIVLVICFSGKTVLLWLYVVHMIDCCHENQHKVYLRYLLESPITADNYQAYLIINALPFVRLNFIPNTCKYSLQRPVENIAIWNNRNLRQHQNMVVDSCWFDFLENNLRWHRKKTTIDIVQPAW